VQNLIGVTIGNYQIVEQLGRGGMANVYKAYHPGLAVHRAVPVIRPALSRTQSVQDRFQREARAIASLRHPNIVQVHDFGQQDDLFYMVMEYVEGEDLKARIQRDGPIRPFSEAIRITEQVASGLGYAHERGILHRDVKPSNILLTRDGCRNYKLRFEPAEHLRAPSTTCETIRSRKPTCRSAGHSARNSSHSTERSLPRPLSPGLPT
jgi:serine/threonine-protein kinase